MNKLEKIADFEKLLKDYDPNQQAKKLAEQVSLTLLVGPSASGRNSLINILTGRGGYQFLVTDTTRKKRIDDGKLEEHGVRYYFIDEEEFLGGLKRRDYLEAAIIHQQQVSGISFRELERISKTSDTAITDFDIVGTLFMLKHVPSTLAIFVLPPSFEEWMERMNKRGQLDPDERLRRLKSAEKEIKTAIDHPDIHFVVNDELESAADVVDELVESHKQAKLDQYNKGEDIDEIAWRLLNSISRELYS